jgi:two-component system NtrC family response regulator
MSKKGTILVCDDEELIRWSLVEHLRGEGFQVVEAANGREGLTRIRESHPAVALLDLRMPEMDGLTVLRTLREEGNDVPVIVLTALGTIEPAIEATRLGASAYMTKPFHLDKVSDTVRRVLDTGISKRAVASGGGRESQAYNGIIGAARTMLTLFETLERLERIDAPTVLITGESGTGKDLIARAIHARGPRKLRPIVEVDCAAIPETLVESTLFGHERGAFTDAKNQKAGLFETAAGGVVFLDEVGELPLTMQAKLLRALENRKFKRVGGNVDLKFDAGILAATNRNLLAEVAAGRFREDLYYRLAVVQLEVPALRARREDIPLLADHFLSNYADLHAHEPPRLSEEALTKLMDYAWPGNIRELRNVMERLSIFSSGAVVRPDSLPANIRYARPTHVERSTFVLPDEGVNLVQLERSLVQQALDRTSGNQSAAARLLGLSRYALRNRMKKFGIPFES